MGHRLFTCIVLIGLATGTVSGGMQASARVIYWERGKNISRQLLPDDRTVVVIKAQSRHVDVPLPLDADLRRIDETAAAIAVIDIESLKTVPTPRGDWASTHVEGKVRELIKTSDKAAFGSANGSFEFDFDGGELKFGETTVRVGEYPLVKVGERYLVMFALDPTALRWYPFQPFRVTQDRSLSRVEFVSHEPIAFSSPIDGQNLDEVANRLRALQKK